MDKNYFFITGLPRSRTAWISNLFSHRNSYCYHELIRHADSIKEMAQLLKQRPETFVGTCDSTFPFYADQMIQEIPACKIVIVEREPHEVFDSLLEAFGREHATQLGELVDMTLEAIEVLKKRYHTTSIPFEEMNDHATVMMMWESLVGRDTFDMERFHHLNMFNMEIIVPKYMSEQRSERVEHVTYHMNRFKEATRG